LVQAVCKGSRRTRHYDHPQTPLDRLLNLKAGNAQQLEELSRLRCQTDPFELVARVQEKLEAIWSHRHFLPRSSEAKAAEEKLKATEEAALYAIAKMFGANVYVRTRPGSSLVQLHHGKIFK